MNMMIRISAATSRGQPISTGRTSAAIVATTTSPPAKRTDPPARTAKASSARAEKTTVAGTEDGGSVGRVGSVMALGGTSLLGLVVGVSYRGPGIGVALAADAALRSRG